MTRNPRSHAARLALLCGCTMVSAIAWADTFRCNNQFVRTGDSTWEVLRACGEPAHREVVSGDDQARVEQWVYEGRFSRFPRVLTFRGGRLIRIERIIEPK